MSRQFFAFNKVYFDAFDKGRKVSVSGVQPADHSSWTKSLAQEVPIRGTCAQLKQFLLCASAQRRNCFQTCDYGAPALPSLRL